jgi:hypothetical protein
MQQTDELSCRQSERMFCRQADILYSRHANMGSNLDRLLFRQTDRQATRLQLYSLIVYLFGQDKKYYTVFKIIIFYSAPIKYCNNVL